MDNPAPWNVSYSRCRSGGGGLGFRRPAAGKRVLRDGTALFYGSFSLLTEDLSFSLPGETWDPPDFAALAAEYAAVLAGPPPGLPPDRGAEFELRIDTGDRPMPRSRPMKRLSQGELEECR